MCRARGQKSNQETRFMVGRVSSSRAMDAHWGVIRFTVSEREDSPIRTQGYHRIDARGAKRRNKLGADRLPRKASRSSFTTSECREERLTDLSSSRMVGTPGGRT